MKKTTYVIIAALVIIFALGIGVAAYVGCTSTPYVPMSERVEIEETEAVDAIVDDEDVDEIITTTEVESVD